MKFAITQTISPDVLQRLKYQGRRIDVSLTEYLASHFTSRDYCTGVNAVYAGLNCVNPKMLNPPKDFETGFLIDKKYIRSKGILEFEVKLNHSEVSKANSNQLIDIIGQALLKSYPEIENLDIKDFDIGRFYTDLKVLLQDQTWLSEPYTEKEFHYQPPQQSRSDFSTDEKMSGDSFWELIEKARVDSQGDIYKQIEIVTDRLSKKSEKEIIGFECTLRELLMKAYHYNVMAVQKIIERRVTDDSFLYFRCKLILHGRITFQNAISNPDYIFERIDPAISGEPLLSVADTAFKFRFGDNTDKILPGEYASEVINYDSGNYEVQGKDWEESDIPKRYSKLWKAYNQLLISIERKLEGYIFVYLSYESESNNYVSFDDFKVTHTKTNVLQYNEYYPFGLQTSNSWTRENASNKYLYNGGNELNEKSGWYETFFRGYDAALGRFMQVDPLASSFASHSPYHYAYNNPVLFNDPFGAESDSTGHNPGGITERFGPFSNNHWSDQYMTMEQWIVRINHMPDGGTWRNGEGYSFNGFGDAASYVRNNFYYDWNQYGGSEIPREKWLLLVGDMGKNKFADHYFSGAWELRQGDRSNVFHFFSASDERYALEYMLLAQELYQKEISAYLVDGPNGCGVLILPWSGNGRTYSNRYINYNSRNKTIADSTNTTHKVLLHIHTHPDDGGTDIPTRPSGDDLRNTRDQAIPAVILTPNYYILMNPSLSPEGHMLNAPHNGGSTQDALKGYDSLYRFIK